MMFMGVEMDIQKQVEFEKFHARECNCDYDELKRRLDHQEKVMGHRYIPSSPRHEAWLVWNAAWKAKAQAVPEGFVLVPKEPTPKMIDATWDFDDEIQEMSHNSRNEFIYKAMIEAQEQSHD